jgi:hypothetical protein
VTHPSLGQSSAPGPGADADPESFILPELRVDPRACLRIQGAELDAFGRKWQIPPLSAADWCELIWDPAFDAFSVFPGLTGEEDELYELILNGKAGIEEAVKFSLQVITSVSGYDYWVTLRAVSALRSSWLQVGGALVRAGMDPEKLSIGAYLSGMFSFLTENMQPKKTTEFFDALRAPPENETEAIVEAEIDDGQAFLAAMRQSL